MTPPRISVQLYSVRDAIAADLDRALARLVEEGYRHVEPYGFVERASEYSAALEKHHLTAPSAHATLIEGTIEETLDAAERLGVATLIEPMVPRDRWTSAEDIAATAAALNALVPRAEARGIRLGYHNHDWEIANRIDGVSALEHFAGLLDERIVLELDLYWAVVGGEEPVALIERLGERVALLHVKDGDPGAGVSGQKPAGSGGIPVEAALRASSPTTLLVTEFDAYAGEGDVFDALGLSLRYVRSVVSA